MGRITEKALIFGRENNLLGLFSEPDGSEKRPISVILLNAGIIHRVGASRFIVELARDLASHGYQTFRFDLSGIGDSALPRREASLPEIVKQDIDDAMQQVDAGNDIVLVGLCSGADNAFHIAPGNNRIKGLVLIDPMVYPTPGFKQQQMMERLTSAKSWWNIVSGRSIALRLKDRISSGQASMLPPDHYGLLTDPPDTLKAKALRLEEQKVQLLYVITGGAHNYCKYPEQVAESAGLRPNSPVLQIEWRPGANHLLSARRDRDWLNETILQWLHNRLENIQSNGEVSADSA